MYIRCIVPLAPILEKRKDSIANFASRSFNSSLYFLLSKGNTIFEQMDSLLTSMSLDFYLSRPSNNLIICIALMK